MGHEIIICTTPLLGEYREQCQQEKQEWVEEHLGAEAAAAMKFSDNKTQLGVDVIIDDRPNLTVGQKNIKFKHWLIVDQPYNRELPEMDHLPVDRIKHDWSDWRKAFAKVGLLY